MDERDLADDENDRTLEGVLLPAAWSASGAVVEVRLMTFDESEYRIRESEVAAHGLARLLRRRVRLVARVQAGEICRVRSVEPIREPATPTRTGF